MLEMNRSSGLTMFGWAIGFNIEFIGKIRYELFV